ncbi:hypothetical protein [Paraburkholderia youngii]|uniref:hypothetical protein n=1 Tax=Paraburkholderia youngii TaxID=2782701 RepID=UPI003D1C47AA
MSQAPKKFFIVSDFGLFYAGRHASGARVWTAHESRASPYDDIGSAEGTVEGIAGARVVEFGKLAILDFAQARLDRERERKLEAAYEWGKQARIADGSYEVEYACFIVQASVDPEAKKRFEAGYSGQ